MRMLTNMFRESVTVYTRRRKSFHPPVRIRTAPHTRQGKIMIVDVHTHIFFPEVRKERSRYMMGEPAFKQIYGSDQARMVSADELIVSMDEHGVDRAVVFGFPWQTLFTAAQSNDYVLEAVRKYPDRLIGFACVYPGGKGVQREVERCLNAGMKGVGELAFYAERMRAEAMLEVLKPILEVCGEHQVPLMLHANETVGHPYPGKAETDLGEMYRLVKSMKPHPVILAHWGGGLFFYELMKKEVSEALSHVFYDTAASPFLYRPRVYSLAVELCGAQRILFGTDYPLLAAGRYFQEMDQAGLSGEQREKILGANARTLLRL